MFSIVFRLAREQLLSNRRSNRHQVVYVITDGNSDDHERALVEAMKTKNENIHIIVVVVGNWFNMQVCTWQNIVTDPKSC